jgi:hypothetical protein
MMFMHLEILTVQAVLHGDHVSEQVDHSLLEALQQVRHC